MRVTNKMMVSTFNKDLNRNLTSLSKINKQLTSGKEISRASDNPFKSSRIMQLKNDISLNEQYNENIKDVTNFLDTTDTALGQITDSMQRIRELMVSAGNATYDQNQMNSLKAEINERVTEISQLLNTTFDGKYIFGGTKTNSKPVDYLVDANGNNKIYLSSSNGSILDLDTTDFTEKNMINNIGSDLYVEISKGVKVDYNVTALDVLQAKDKQGNAITFMELMSNITNNLGDSASWSEVYSANLGEFDLFINNLNNLRSEVGAKQNRMESAQMQNEENNYNLTNLLSNIEDIDFAEKNIELASMQAIYTASLQVSASIIQPTILDFLR